MDIEKRFINHLLKEEGGVELTLTHGFTIGKGGDSSFILPSIQGEGKLKFLVLGIWVVVREEGGGVGALINGKPFKGERILKSGDTIELGGKRFLFETIQDDITAAKTRLFTMKDIEKFVHFMKKKEEMESKAGTLILSPEELGEKVSEEAPVEPERVGGGTMIADFKEVKRDEVDEGFVGGETKVFKGEEITSYPLLLLLEEGGKGITEYPLNREDIKLGRAEDNNIILNHETISSHHARLIVDKKVLIKDLNSTNGIFVNGERITEAELVHGDILELGDLRFIFVQAGRGITLPREEKGIHPSPQIKEVSRRRAKVLRFVLFGILFLFVVAGAILYLLPERRVAHEMGATPSEKQAKVGKGEEKSTAPKDPLSMAKDAYDTRNWELLLSLDGSIREEDSSYQEFQALLEKGRLEIKNRESFILIGEKLKEGRIDEARGILSSLPDDSVYHEVALREIERVVRQKIEPLITMAMESKKKGKLEEALKRIDEVLKLDPKFEKALTLKEEIESTLRRRRMAHEEKMKRERAVTNFEKKFMEIYLTESADTIIHAITEERSKGKIPPQSVSFLNDILLSATLYKEGERLKDSGAEKGAVQKFEEFLHTDDKLTGGGRGNLRRSAIAYLVTYYLKKGEESLGALNYKDSARYFKRVLSLDSANARARTGLKKIEEKASELYQDGYVLLTSYNDCVRATQKFRQVMELVPEESDLFKKASSNLEKCK